MELNRRLRAIEQAAGAEGCPECGAGGGGRIQLLPMLIGGEPAKCPDPVPCPRCGAMPIRLLPMRLDGGVDLNEAEQ